MFFFEKIYIFRYFLEALDITKSDREARFFRFIENWMRWIRLQSFLRKLNDKTEKRIFLANLDVYDKEMKISSHKSTICIEVKCFGLQIWHYKGISIIIRKKRESTKLNLLPLALVYLAFFASSLWFFFQ